jgi:hypothetical protein
MRRAEESFFCRTARISKTRAARCGRARSHEVTTRISDRRKAFAGARAAVPGAAALYMARQTCSTWALTAFALANERAREARACPPLRGEQHAARPRASGVACGSAARSKHSETRRRSSLALVMLRKKKQWSATPLMPNVLLLEPTAARARVGLGLWGGEEAVVLHAPDAERVVARAHRCARASRVGVRGAAEPVPLTAMQRCTGFAARVRAPLAPPPRAAHTPPLTLHARPPQPAPRLLPLFGNREAPDPDSLARSARTDGRRADGPGAPARRAGPHLGSACRTGP